MAAHPPPPDGPSHDALLARAQAAERELDALAAVLAHDLRAPLRAIDGFSHVLLTPERADALPDETRRFLALVRDAGTELAQRLDDVVDYVRATRATLDLQEVDPARLAREVVQAVLEPRAEAGAGAEGDVTWAIGEVPPCRADRALLRRLLEELLDHARRSGARTVELAWDAGAAAYAIRDDGRGFDGDLPARALAPFGAGVALAARIAERHGGRVWGRGTPGAGATLWFTIDA